MTGVVRTRGGSSAEVTTQESYRFRFWAACPELGGRYLRVVTLADKVTIHNAFPDRVFKP